MRENYFQAPEAPDNVMKSDQISITPAQLFWGCLTTIAISFLLCVLTYPFVSTPREASRRTQCGNNLKQILLALHNYHDKYQTFPPAYTVDSEGNPLHSWRTLILPYLDDLNKSCDLIDLSKPWNDPANAAAFRTKVYAYSCPSAEFDGNLTTYHAVLGKTAMFRPVKSIAIPDNTDPHSDTVMVIETNTELAVPWMEPHDLGAEFLMTLDAKTKTSHKGMVHVGCVDGSVHRLPITTDLKTRWALITIDGHEPLIDWDHLWKLK